MYPVTWFSIPARDIDRAATFYSQVFGWRVQPLTKEVDDVYNYYVMVNAESNAQYEPEQPGRINGCIVKRETGITMPAVLVEVNDLDEAARRVAEAGGTVVSGTVPMRSLNGKFILVRDPDGNMVEVFADDGPRE